MKISWKYHENIMKISWKYHENIMKISWKYHENIMKISWKDHEKIMKRTLNIGMDYNTHSLFHPEPVQTEGPVSCSASVLRLPFVPYERSGLPNGHGKNGIVSPSQYQQEQRTKYSKTKQKKHCKKTGHYNLKLSYHSSYEYRPCYV